MSAIATIPAVPARTADPATLQAWLRLAARLLRENPGANVPLLVAHIVRQLQSGGPRHQSALRALRSGYLPGIEEPDYYRAMAFAVARNLESASDLL